MQFIVSNLFCFEIPSFYVLFILHVLFHLISLVLLPYGDLMIIQVYWEKRERERKACRNHRLDMMLKQYILIWIMLWIRSKELVDVFMAS